MKTILFSLLLLIAANNLWAQENKDSLQVYTLKVEDAVNHALEYNANVKNAALDIEIAKKTVWETTAIGLPQVNATASLTDNLALRTTLFPDFITQSVVGINKGYFGLTPTTPVPASTTMPVQFGQQYAANWGFTANQLIFSGEYIVGLQASRAYLEMSKNAMEKTKIDTKQSVSQAYYNVLVLRKSVELTNFTYTNMKQVLDEMKQSAAAGFIQQTDIDQMELTVNNMKSSLSTIKIYKDLAEKMLKIQLGVDIKDSVVLTENLDDIIANTDYEGLVMKDFDINEYIDYKMIQNQENLQELTLKQQESKTLPTLSAYYTFSKDAQRDSFNIFKSGDAYPWYKSSSIGLQLNIPIFASGSRSVKIQKEKLALEKIKNNKYVAEESFNVQFEQLKTKLLESIDAYQSAKKNMALSLSIKDNILAKYKQGLASSIDLAQAQNQNLQAQNEYFQKIIDLLNNKLALERMLESGF
jgi:outer membrane protein TolC